LERAIFISPRAPPAIHPHESLKSSFCNTILGTTSTSITASREAAPSQRWTVPLVGTVTRLIALSKQPIQIGSGAFDNVARPPGAGEWQARLQLSFLVRKGKK
jgi:hypothetical protein